MFDREPQQSALPRRDVADSRHRLAIGGVSLALAVLAAACSKSTPHGIDTAPTLSGHFGAGYRVIAQGDAQTPLVFFNQPRERVIGFVCVGDATLTATFTADRGLKSTLEVDCFDGSKNAASYIASPANGGTPHQVQVTITPNDGQDISWRVYSGPENS